MLGIMVFLGVICTALLAFTFGRATADHRVNLNHHKMMMLLMDIRTVDDTVPIVPAAAREKLDRLLSEYERLDLDDR